MPLREPEPKFSYKTSLLLGLPLFLIAVLVSIFIHQSAHMFAREHGCSSPSSTEIMPISPALEGNASNDCPISSLAGVTATLALALVSFAFLIHYPKNMLFASLAFVNASTRLPEAVTLIYQMVFKQPSSLLIDENAALHLFHFKDPSAYIVILCFYIIGLFFFSIIVIHDTKMIPRKWLAALILFIILGPLEQFLWDIISPIIS